MKALFCCHNVVSFNYQFILKNQCDQFQTLNQWRCWACNSSTLHLVLQYIFKIVEVVNALNYTLFHVKSECCALFFLLVVYDALHIGWFGWFLGTFLTTAHQPQPDLTQILEQSKFSITVDPPDTIHIIKQRIKHSVATLALSQAISFTCQSDGRRLSQCTLKCGSTNQIKLERFGQGDNFL